MKDRKIVQITKLNYFTLLALCDDGTLWYCKHVNKGNYSHWEKATGEIIKAIPQS